jgi:phosphonate degradation associated HDIG domain protein
LLAKLLSEHGCRQYGNERVSQLDHALQCADLADKAGEPAPLIAAALLHDIGHLLASARKRVEIATPEERDDLHQYIALPLLRGLVPESVLQPIRLHVDAKRFLCAIEPEYRAGLSAESQRSLALQGGAHTATQAQAFLSHPFAADAIRLRRYDDQAKVPGKTTRPLAHFLWILELVAIDRQSLHAATAGRAQPVSRSPAA